ncbi:hypothetical protein [Streptosporangium sp. V21-05]|uniref:hypothetical protein n=1 Tax=Streptosporangium sp. V21-05 TaxID=3446115 RepID=UPI003F52FBD7
MTALGTILAHVRPNAIVSLPEGLGQLLVVLTAASGSRAADRLRDLSAVHHAR